MINEYFLTSLAIFQITYSLFLVTNETVSIHFAQSRFKIFVQNFALSLRKVSLQSTGTRQVKKSPMIDTCL